MSMEFDPTPSQDPDQTGSPVSTLPRSTTPAVDRTQAAPAPGKPRGGLRLGELIWLCLAVVDAFLALDYVFRAIAINGDGFSGVVTRVGNALASPFAGLFGAGAPRVGHTVFWAAPLAIVIYSLAGLVLARLIHLVSGPLRRRQARA
jgi:hypothetical protein